MTFIINIFKDCPPDLHKKHHTLKQKILAGFKYALTDVLYLANLRLRIRARCVHKTSFTLKRTF